MKLETLIELLESNAYACNEDAQIVIKRAYSDLEYEIDELWFDEDNFNITIKEKV